MFLQILLFTLFIHDAHLESTGNKSVAIYIVGEPRTLTFTIASLTKNILTPLKDNGYTWVFFIFTHKHSSHSQYGLLDDSFNSTSIIHMLPSRHSPNATLANTVGRWLKFSFANGAYGSELLARYYNRWRVNLMHMAYEAKHGVHFDWVLILRPDVVYFQNLPVQQLFNSSHLVTLDWHQSLGVNDRFFAMPAKFAADFCSLYPFLLYAENITLPDQYGNSEGIHKWYLELRNIPYTVVEGFKFVRLRSNVLEYPNIKHCPLTQSDIFLGRKKEVIQHICLGMDLQGEAQEKNTMKQSAFPEGNCTEVFSKVCEWREF